MKMNATILVIGSILVSFNAFGAGELTSKQTANITLMNDQMENVRDRKPEKFLEAVTLLKGETMALNKQAIGLRSKKLDTAAAKIEEIAIAVANSFKHAQALSKGSDLKNLSNRLHQLDRELTATKKSIDKKFLTAKRTQARDYQLKAIEVLEMLIDDAIATVPIKD